jgi:hypothetical protein
MYIPAMIRECDITDKKYAEPVMGAYALARGATGRWCPVLAFGPEALAEYALPVTDYDTARKHIEAQGDWLDY